MKKGPDKAYLLTRRLAIHSRYWPLGARSVGILTGLLAATSRSFKSVIPSTSSTEDL